MEFNATFIVAFISFIIFIIIMNQILYKPINSIIEKRNKLIDDNYNDANKNCKKSKEILQDRLDELQNARSRVREEASLQIEKAKQDKISSEKQAKEEIKVKIDEHLSDLKQDEKKAKDILKNDIISLAQLISDKLIEAPERIENVDMSTIEKIMQD